MTGKPRTDWEAIERENIAGVDAIAGYAPNRSMAQAKELLSWMKSRGSPVVGFCEILQYGPASMRTKAVADDLVSVLVDHQWIVEDSARPRRFRVSGTSPVRSAYASRQRAREKDPAPSRFIPSSNEAFNMFQWPNDIVAPIYYANSQWAVTEFGLESLDQPYAIERGQIAEKHKEHPRLSDWVVHLAEKEWVDLHEFVDALGRALEFHRVKGRTLIDLHASKALALSERRRAKEFDEFCRGLGERRREMRAADLMAAEDLFVETCRRSR